MIKFNNGNFGVLPLAHYVVGQYSGTNQAEFNCDLWRVTSTTCNFISGYGFTGEWEIIDSYTTLQYTKTTS